MTGPYTTEAPFAFDLGVKSVTAVEDGDLILEGFAATYGDPETTDLQNEFFEPGAWTQDVIDEFLSGQAPCLANHDPDRPLGKVIDAELRPGGLWAKILIPRPKPGSWADREDWHERLRRNLIRGMSVAGRFWRRVGADGIPRIYRSSLAEISVSPHPVNPMALGTVSLATAAQKAFSTAPDDDLTAIKSVLSNLKQEASMWSRKQKTQPEPRATMLYADDDPDRARREQKGFEAQRQHEAHRQAKLVDGPNVVAEDEAFRGPLASLYGYELAPKYRDNERVEREVTLTGDQWAALNGVAGRPVDPRDLPGKSALDVFGATPSNRIAAAVEKLRTLEGAKADA